MSRILVFDPSGNFDEGKGTSGWALFVDGKLNDFGEIASEDYVAVELYWDAHRTLTEGLYPDIVVCESFKLNPAKAGAQSWSYLETPQLIGYLRMGCWHRGIEFITQDPSTKVRFADEILEGLGIIEKRGKKYYCMNRETNLHKRDAIRHGIYYLKYGKKV